MTPEKYRRLKSLFEQALDTPPEQLAAFLLKIRLADEELCRELEELLLSHRDSGHAMAAAAGDESATRTMDRPVIGFRDRLSREMPSFATNEVLLGRFRITRFIVSGGMGEVYEAEDLQLGRVALKTIRTDLAARPAMLVRFRQEVQLSRKITSPNVCRVHDLFPFPSGERRTAAAFLTMEFLEGVTLADRLDSQGALPLPEAETIAQQLCAALQAIHGAGIVHRDIKPRNIMLVPRAGGTQAVVMDLGLAHESVSAPENHTSLTATGAVMGTPPYMAPEQFESAATTPATDIYALGIILYEMVTGKHPYQSSTPLAAAVRRARRPPLPSSVRQKLPHRWDTVIGRCLEHDAALRYQTANEVAEALRGKYLARTRRLAGYAAAALLVAAGIAAIARLPLLNRSPGSGGTPPVQTLVVLPFDNLGGDPANQALCDGLQETATSMLSQAESSKKDVLIVPSSELRANRVRTIAEARKLVGADLALTGSLEKTANALQLTLNLTDAKTLRQRDSRILTVKPDEMAGLSQRLAAEIDSLVGTGSALRQQQSAPGATTTNSEAFRLYVQGQGALENRNWDQAADDLASAVAKDPSFTAAAAKLAEARVRQYNASQDAQRLAQADSILRRAEQNGQTPETMFAQAMIWQATGVNEKAAPLLRQLLQIEPNNVSALNMLAATLMAAGRNSEAEGTYQTAIRLRPGYWPAYNGMADFYRNENNPAKAEAAYLAGIAIAPQVPSLHNNLGGLYLDQGRWDEAAREFQKSIDLKPYYAGYANLGTIAFFEGKYAEAAKQDRLATTLRPNNQILWGNLGDALWQISDRRQQARETFTKAYTLASQQLVLNPADVQLRKSLALYLAKLGRYTEARTEIEAAIRQAPKDKYVRFYAARIFAVIGDLKRAAEEVKACRTLDYDPKEIEHEPDLSRISSTGDPKGGQFTQK
jgi:serine/threonine-protein kinase